MRNKISLFIIVVLIISGSCLERSENDIIDILSLESDCDKYYKVLNELGFSRGAGFNPYDIWFGNIEGKKYFIEAWPLENSENKESYKIYRKQLEKDDRYLEKKIIPKLISILGSPVIIKKSELIETPNDYNIWLSIPDEFFLWSQPDRDIYIFLDYETKHLNEDELILVIYK